MKFLMKSLRFKMKDYYILFSILFLLTACNQEDIKEIPVACFEFDTTIEIVIGDTISFINCSENATQFSWDFGDGNTSEAKNPRHGYDSIGNFNVALFAANEYFVDTLVKSVTIEPKPDKILYFKGGDSLAIQSVRYSVNSDYGPNIPLPFDSTAYINIDMNKDSIMDFHFTASHKYPHPNSQGHANRTGYTRYVKGLNIDSDICIQNISPSAATKFDYLELIPKFDSSDYSYRFISYFHIDVPMAPYLIFDSSYYIGVKINNNYGWIKVEPMSNNGIRIVEYAINLTPNNEIRAGQKS